MHLLLTLIALLPAPLLREDFLRVVARFDPDSATIEVTATLSIERAPDTEMAFYLNKSLEVQEISGPDVESYRREAGEDFMDQFGARYVVSFAPATAATELRFRYQGPLQDAFHDGWIELFADRVWTPFEASWGRPFHYDASIQLPPSYRLVGMGTASQSESGWNLRSRIPSLEVAFVAGTGLETSTHEHAGRSVHIVANDLAAVPADRIAQLVHAILDRYHALFGGARPQQEVSLLFRTVDGLPGYARPGYLVLEFRDDFEANREAYARYFAHELAHLWWHRGHAAGPENWLNESFAEYSALRTLHALFGEETYRKRIDELGDVVPGLPAIRDITRTSPQARSVFYQKGPFLLFQLEDRIGGSAFDDLLYGLVEEEVRTTDGLLQLLADLEGDEVAGWFEAALKE